MPRLRIALIQLGHAPGRTTILALCIAVSIAIPTLTSLLVRHYDARLAARAEATPLVAGATGNRIDLTLASLYFRRADFDPIPYARYEEVRDWRLGVAVPLNLRFSARGRPIVACSPEYYEQRRLSPASGRIPLRMGEVALGHDAALSFELAPGDALFSDQRELYDISKPAALKMNVVGILAETGGPDDRAVFVDIKSAWILEGISHGHIEADEVPEDRILARGEGNLKISEAMIEYNEVTAENEASYHYHGDTEGLPLSSILFFPRDRKSGTIARARMNANRLWQMVTPVEVVDELMSKVFQVKAFLDGVSLLVGASTALLVGLVLVLSTRMRRRELVTLHHVGFQRSTIASLLGLEVLALLAVGALLGALLVTMGWLGAPDLVTAL